MRKYPISEPLPLVGVSRTCIRCSRRRDESLMKKVERFMETSWSCLHRSGCNKALRHGP